MAEADEADRVTPTARHSCWASSSDVAISLPVQEVWMQDVTELTKALFLHRQLSSLSLQSPKSAFARHESAHAARHDVSGGIDYQAARSSDILGNWRLKMPARVDIADAEATTPERAMRTSEKRMVLDGRLGMGCKERRHWCTTKVEAGMQQRTKRLRRRVARAHSPRDGLYTPFADSHVRLPKV